MMLPSTTHDGMPSTSVTYGIRSFMPGGADRVQRSCRSDMWESASITLTGRSVSSMLMSHLRFLPDRCYASSSPNAAPLHGDPCTPDPRGCTRVTFSSSCSVDHATGVSSPRPRMPTDLATTAFFGPDAAMRGRTFPMNLFVLKTWLETKLHKDEDGASLVEYILLVALIALAVIAAVIFLRNQISDKFSEAGSKLSANN